MLFVGYCWHIVASCSWLLWLLRFINSVVYYMCFVCCATLYVLYSGGFDWFGLMRFVYILVCCSCLFGGLLYTVDLGWLFVMLFVVVSLVVEVRCADCYFAGCTLIVLLSWFFMAWFCFV